MDQVNVYTPESMIRKPGALLSGMWRDMKNGRQLAWKLAVRDTSAQYRQALLGIGWMLLLPLANTVTWLFLKQSGVVAIGETSLPYPVYVFTGTMIWSIFLESLQAPLQKTVSNKGMLSKINFPREALILSSFYQSLFGAGAKTVALIGGLLLLGFDFIDWPLLMFPVGVLAIIIVGTAGGALLTPIGLLYTDIGKGLPVVLTFLMYLTPVIFPPPQSGWTASFINNNPITPLIMASRDWLTGFESSYSSGLFVVTLISIVVLFFVLIVYRLAMPILVERFSS